MKTSGKYILVGQTPVPCDDLIEWALWFEVDEHRQVRLTKVGRWEVSTIFLGLDYNPVRRKGPPLLFETMVFRPVKPYRDLFGILHRRKIRPGIQERCATWMEAEEQHERIVKEIRQPGDKVKQLVPTPLPEFALKEIESKSK